LAPPLRDKGYSLGHSRLIVAIISKAL